MVDFLAVLREAAEESAMDLQLATTEIDRRLVLPSSARAEILTAARVRRAKGEPR